MLWYFKYLKFETVGMMVRNQCVKSFMLTIANITVKVGGGGGHTKPPEFVIFKAPISFFESLQIVWVV